MGFIIFPYAHIMNFDRILPLYNSLLSSSLYFFLFHNFNSLSLRKLSYSIIPLYYTCGRKIYFPFCELLIFFYLIKLSSIHQSTSNIISLFSLWCVNICIWVHVCHRIHVEVILGFLLLPYWS